MTYGYVKPFSNKEKVEIQIRHIKGHSSNVKIIQEIYLESSLDHPKLDKLIDDLQAGDTLVLESVSRLDEDTEMVYKIYTKLIKKGVNVVFIKEPMLNSNIYSLIPDELTIDKMINSQIKATMENYQTQKDDYSAHIRLGIDRAKRNGKQIGLPKGTRLVTKKSIQAKADILKYSIDFNGTLSDTECLKLIKVCRNSFYKYKQELLDEKANNDDLF